MIQITVIDPQSASAGHPATARFDAGTGTIGRAATNTLVLDDPERTVSRVHAQVVCRNGCFFIIDRGSNPLLLNGQMLGAGNEAPLNDGDHLMIGNFELAVHELAPPADSPAQPARPAADGPPANEDPFANLMDGLQPAPAASATPALPTPAAEGVPDPFADVPPPAPPAAQAARGQGALDDFSDLITPVGEGAPSIDSLFGGLGGGNAGGDPLANSPLADPLHRPNTAGAADPLAALAGSAAPPTPAPRNDHAPIGQFRFVPPQAVGPATAAAPAPTPAPAVAAHAAAPPPPPACAPPVMPPAAAPAPPPAGPSPSPGEPAPRAGDDVLLAALLRGLGDVPRPPEALTPELMERIGALLRDAVEGTLQLLLARQELKQELRAERTVIVAQDNNPLKFSPTVQVALAHLLGSGMPGFMPANEAMRDAFDDLRAHQFGVMVGTRAALDHLVARFAPAELEKKISDRSALDHLFAAHRKARLWDRFVQFYADIAAEAEDDFHSVFGKAFVRAYEQQMERMK